jgi:septal ring factor EnvC (AmiA/AmiB activator)
LKGEEITNKVVFTADNAEILFPNLEEDAEVVVGESATIDGTPAEGEVTAADGRILVFEGGVLTEIKEEVTSELTDDELEEVLTEILEVVETIAEEVEELQTEMKVQKKEKAEIQAKLKKAEDIIAKMKGAGSPAPEDDKKEKNGKKQEVSGVVAQWKANKLKKK